jgi:hypothetical protein
MKVPCGRLVEMAYCNLQNPKQVKTMEIFIAVITLLAFLAYKAFKGGTRSLTQQLIDQPEKLYRWPTSGCFDQEVVGESNYQSALRSIWDKCTEEGLDAILLHEDTNKHDNKAVAVLVDKKLVGYLNRNDARAFRRRCEKERVGSVSICKARVFGREGKEGLIGIWLDL